MIGDGLFNLRDVVEGKLSDLKYDQDVEQYPEALSQDVSSAELSLASASVAQEGQKENGVQDEHWDGKPKHELLHVVRRGYEIELLAIWAKVHRLWLGW